MPKKFLAVVIFIITLLTSVFSGCSSDSGSALDFYCFSTVIHVETHDKPMSNSVKTELEELFNSLDTEFDPNSENSQVFKFNSANKNQQISVSAEFNDVFEICKELYTLTNGKFNPCVYPLIKLWSFNDYPKSNFTPPTSEQINSLLGQQLDFNGVSVSYSEQDQKYYAQKSFSETQIDFGGILKGYAVNKASEILKNAGHNKGYVNIGGSSLYLLSVESLSITHPRATSEIPLIINVNCSAKQNTAVSTSGDYQRYYEYQGNKYHHLIDTTTGTPSRTGVISATVLGKDGAFADALTTALCLLNHQPDNQTSELIEFIKNLTNTYPSIAVYVVYLNGDNRQIITNQSENVDFTLLDSSYMIKKI